MSSITDFNTISDCDKIDADCIAANTSLELDEDNATGLCLNSSFGSNCVDLTSVVKAAETVTHLYLSPEDDPACLVFEREDGDSDCIHGDDLSRIISMTKLKDVDQDTPIANGNVYMYNETTGQFEPYDLQSFINTTNNHLTTLDASIVNLQNQITGLGNRLSAIENAIFNWAGDKNTKIARGNINVYGDYTNTDSHDHGIFTHNPDTDVTDDLYFS